MGGSELGVKINVVQIILQHHTHHSIIAVDVGVNLKQEKGLYTHIADMRHYIPLPEGVSPVWHPGMSELFPVPPSPVPQLYWLQDEAWPLLAHVLPTLWEEE